MTAADRSGNAHSIGWVASLSLHGTLALGALLVTQRITLAPQPAPFTWNVAMVAAPLERLQVSNALPTPVHTRVITASSQARLPSTSATPANSAVSTNAPTVETAPAASDELLAHKNQVPPITNSSAPVDANEPQQAVDQVLSPTQTATLTSPLPDSEQELTSTLMPKALSLIGEQESDLSAQSASMAPAVPSVNRPDYAWLSETIMRRMHELKRYPAEARLDRAEGKVVLKAVIRNNGTIDAVEVFQSSGHQSLDKAAVDLLNLAAPFHFPRPLERPQMTVKIPMNYRLEP